jgi:hypothetical protein
MKAAGISVAPWVETMVAKGLSFYTTKNGKGEF